MYCDRVEISSTTRASPMVWCQCLPWGRRHCIQWTTSPGLLGARWPASSLSEKVSGAPRWWLSEDKRERDLRVSEIVSPVLRISGGEVLDHLSSLVHMRTVRMNIPSSSSPSRAGGMNKGALSLPLGTGTDLQAGMRWPVDCRPAMSLRDLGSRLPSLSIFGRGCYW